MKTRKGISKLWLIFGGGALALLLAAIVTMGSLTIPIQPTGSGSVVVLYALSTFIVLAFLIFGLVLGRTLVRLWSEHRAQELGSRFKTKMFFGATAISLAPIAFLFFVSFGLMNHTLNRWFPRSLERASGESRDLLREGDRIELGELTALGRQATTEAVAAKPSKQHPVTPIEAAARLAMQRGADGVWATDGIGKPLSTGFPSGKPVTFDPMSKFARDLPDAEVWASEGKHFLASRVPLGDDYLIVGRHAPDDLVGRYNDVETQTVIYGLEHQRIQTFKTQMLLELSLITLLLLFSATWFALYLSKQVTVPIQALAEATKQVAAGHFDTRVRVRAQDELGTLVRAFNAMTVQLADSHKQVDESTANLQKAVQELDLRRTLLETVLENIPTGVLSLDNEGFILRMNTAAREIFGEVASHSAATFATLAGTEAARDVQHLMRRSLRMGAASKELEFRLAGRVVHAAVTVSALGPRRAGNGFVVVVDDLTDLLHAQKAAAWQEVAQRVAHEIKNPLTPIQLSAERLLRYINRRDGDGRSPELTKLVGECATLIGREVGTLAALVNEFSQFARFPNARLSPADPNAIVFGALEVFRGRLDGVKIHTSFADGLPLIKADAELLRRVIVNLIDNAAEAMEGSSTRHLELVTRFHAAHDTVEIAVADTGHGISPEDKDKLFLPHFSTKDRGTGLGLAIASRVVAEHHGLMRAEDNLPIGARFVIELPAAEPAFATLDS